MKALNYLGTAALAAYAIFALTACNGTSNGSTSTSTCTLNTVTGMYVDQNGNACAGTSSTVTTCPTTGIALVNGVQQACTPGQIISTGTTGIGTIGGAPAGYPYGSNPAAGSGCSSYLYEYGVQYVPIYYGGQLVCANYPDLIASMSTQYYSSYTSTPYYNNPSYWYSYPPYSSSYGAAGSAYFSGYGASSGYGGSSFSLNLGIGFSF